MTVPLIRYDGNDYGSVKIGQVVPCGPPLFPSNVLYFASVTDGVGYTVSSRVYHGAGPLAFGTVFSPRIEHWRGDDLPVPPPPARGTSP